MNKQNDVDLIKVENSISKLEILDNNLLVVEKFADYIMKSNIAPESIKDIKSAVVALLMGAELGFKPLSSLNNIHVISGKPSLSVNAYTAKMIQHGILYTIINDYKSEIIYKSQYAGNFKHSEIIKNPELYHIANTIDEDLTEPKRLNKIILRFLSKDIYTEIEFSRLILLQNNTYKEFKITHKIYMSEIEMLGLLIRDQWIKQSRTMLRTRVLTAGARLICPDVFLGLYTDIEIKELNKESFNFNEEKGVIEDIDYTENT